MTNMLATDITLDQVLAVRGMKIEIAYPPNIDAIDKAIPGVKRNAIPRGVLFAYGKTIFNPCGRTVPVHLIAHECTHAIQQERIGLEKWWNDYLADKDFRFEQELEAHRVEYQEYIRNNSGRAFRRRYIAACAERLAGPIYGNIIKKDAAKKLILTGEMR